MNTTAFRLLLACGVGLAWVASAGALDQVLYRSLIEKETVRFGNTVQYLVEVHYGTGTMTPNVTQPSFEQFDVLNAYQTNREVGEGRDAKMVLKKMWLLKPREPGRLSIAAAIITYQDPTTNLLKTGKTNVQFVQVERAGTQQAAASGTTDNARGTGIWIFVLVLLAGAGAAVWFLFGRPAAPEPSAPAPTPEASARAALERTAGHLERGDLEGFFRDLTTTLLEYGESKFALPVHELSTAALLERFGEVGLSRELNDALRDFFRIADRAKFAGYVPDENEILVLHRTVTRVIEEGSQLAARTGARSRFASKPAAEDE